MAEARSFHLWRAYPSEPFDRFACTLAYDSRAEDGYRVVDFDSGVADAGFLHRLNDHMSKPAAAFTATNEDGHTTEHAVWLRPGSEDHFAEAARSFPLASVSSRGRQA